MIGAISRGVEDKHNWEKTDNHNIKLLYCLDICCAPLTVTSRMITRWFISIKDSQKKTSQPCHGCGQHIEPLIANTRKILKNFSWCIQPLSCVLFFRFFVLFLAPNLAVRFITSARWINWAVIFTSSEFTFLNQFLSKLIVFGPQISFCSIITIFKIGLIRNNRAKASCPLGS